MPTKARLRSHLMPFLAVLALAAISLPGRCGAETCSSTAYGQEFESGAVPPEWATGTGVFGASTGGFYGSLPGFGSGFLQNKTVPPLPSVLRLQNLPPHSSVDVEFLLAIINSWDGIGGTGGGDAFNVTVNGTVVFSHVFALGTGTSDYAPPPGVFMGISGWNEAFNMYLEPAFHGIADTSSTLEIHFYASGGPNPPSWEGGDNESWAVDHLRVVLHSEKGPTTLLLTSDANPSVYGQTVSFTATLTPLAALGTVDFFLGSATSPFASGTVSGGTAAASLSGLPVGTASIRARYNPTACYDTASSQSLDQVVTPVGTLVALHATPNPSIAGNAVALTATINPPTGTGAVAFFDGVTSLGSVAVVGGSAALSVLSLSPGTHSLTAFYGGDSNHYGGTSPPVTQSVISPNPVIVGVRDVPNDQGGRIFLAWRCSLDQRPHRVVTGYRVWRRAPWFSVASRARADDNSTLLATGAGAPLRVIRTVQPNGTVQESYWEAIATLPSEQLVNYAYTTSTAQDSLPGSNPYTAFFVTALTVDPFVFYESEVDSGYSVDNLPPSTPTPFTVVYTGAATALHWGRNSEPDFWEYRVYRGDAAGFVPGPANLVAATGETGYEDSGPVGAYYKLSAVDIHGGESPFALATLTSLLEVRAEGQLTFTLEPVRPNPTRGDQLAVGFVLSSAGPASIDVLDVAGRRMATREVGSLGIGRHDVDLARGARLTPGVYLVRLTQGAQVSTRRVCLLE